MGVYGFPGEEEEVPPVEKGNEEEGGGEREGGRHVRWETSWKPSQKKVTESI